MNFYHFKPYQPKINDKYNVAVQTQRCVSLLRTKPFQNGT